MTPRAALLRLLLAGAALGAAAPAAAQTLRVRVVERDGGAPVAGAIVSLLGADSARVAPGLTDADGRQTLRAAAAGTYRVQVERIGFATVVTLPVELEAGRTRDLPVLLTSRATQLAGVRVVDRRTCSADPARTAATADLWAEARKALTASELTVERRAALMELRRYERVLDERLRVLRDTTTRVQVGVSERPYLVPPPETLAEKGYVWRADSMETYYAPDARVLLSDIFLRDHCFAAAGTSEQDPRLVGLAFRPIRRRGDLADVAGTLWLDAATSELRHVVFRYENLAGPREAADVGGRLDFQRLPNGLWLISRWHIRMPSLAARLVPGGGRELVLLGYKEEGGTGRALDRPPPAASTVAGVVFDSTRGAGVAGARLTIVGPDGAAVADSTDAVGRFARTMPAGRYTVRVDHPLFAHPGTRGEVEIDVAPGDSSRALAYAPAAPTLAALSCPAAAASSPEAPLGMLVGRVRDPAGGPLAFAAVAIRWDAATPLVAGARVRVGPRGRELRVTADVSGRYVACAVPAAVPLVVGPAAQTGEAADAPLTVPAGGVVGRDVVVTRRER